MPQWMEDPFVRNTLTFAICLMFTGIALLPPSVALLLWIYKGSDWPGFENLVGSAIWLLSSPTKDTLSQIALAPVAALASILAILCFSPPPPGAPANANRLLNPMGRYLVVVLIAGITTTGLFYLGFDALRGLIDEFVGQKEIEQLRSSTGILLSFQLGYGAQLFGLKAVK